MADYLDEHGNDQDKVTAGLVQLAVLGCPPAGGDGVARGEQSLGSMITGRGCPALQSSRPVTVELDSVPKEFP
jgi:hypothetical protein